MAAYLCEVEGCGRGLRSAIHCAAHHARLQQWGDVLADVPVKQIRPRVTRKKKAAVAYEPTPAEGHGLLWLV